MPKQKTHKATKKRFRLTASGKAKHRSAGTSHLMSRAHAEAQAASARHVDGERSGDEAHYPLAGGEQLLKVIFKTGCETASGGFRLRFRNPL